MTNISSDIKAKKAGENAYKQMKIALRSNDPSVQNKCWLFVAMSLMQQGQVKRSKWVIMEVHRDVKDKDEVLTRMSQGIWARLQYVWRNQSKHNKVLSR